MFSFLTAANGGWCPENVAAEAAKKREREPPREGRRIGRNTLERCCMLNTSTLGPGGQNQFCAAAGKGECQDFNKPFSLQSPRASLRPACSSHPLEAIDSALDSCYSWLAPCIIFGGVCVHFVRVCCPLAPQRAPKRAKAGPFARYLHHHPRFSLPRWPHPTWLLLFHPLVPKKRAPHPVGVASSDHGRRAAPFLLLASAASSCLRLQAGRAFLQQMLLNLSPHCYSLPRSALFGRLLAPIGLL